MLKDSVTYNHNNSLLHAGSYSYIDPTYPNIRVQTTHENEYDVYTSDGRVFKCKNSIVNEQSGSVDVLFANTRIFIGNEFIGDCEIVVSDDDISPQITSSVSLYKPHHRGKGIASCGFLALKVYMHLANMQLTRDMTFTFKYMNLPNVNDQYNCVVNNIATSLGIKDNPTMEQILKTRPGDKLKQAVFDAIQTTFSVKMIDRLHGFTVDRVEIKNKLCFAFKIYASKKHERQLHIYHPAFDHVYFTSVDEYLYNVCDVSTHIVLYCIHIDAYTFTLHDNDGSDIMAITFSTKEEIPVVFQFKNTDVTRHDFYYNMILVAARNYILFNA
jgi:hypothetical protein